MLSVSPITRTKPSATNFSDDGREGESMTGAFWSLQVERALASRRISKWMQRRPFIYNHIVSGSASSIFWTAPGAVDVRSGGGGGSGCYRSRGRVLPGPLLLKHFGHDPAMEGREVKDKMIRPHTVQD